MSPLKRRRIGAFEVFIREVRKLEIEPASAGIDLAPMISAIRISEAATVRRRFYDDFNIEIGTSLGPLKARSRRGIGTAPGGHIELLAKALRRSL